MQPSNPKNSWDSWAGLLLWGKEELRAFGPRESLINAEYLLEEASGEKHWRFCLEETDRPSGAVAEKYREWIQARKRRIPAAYVTGRAFFRNEILEVGPGCLVPRPETERLVEAVIEKAGFLSAAEFSFLDLGTGSGAIALALLRHFQNARAVLSDISQEALALARRNAGRYGLEARADFIRSDLFANLRGRWPLIVSNPPYLAAADWADVEPELGHEPRLALDGGTDGLDCYRRILESAPQFLLSGGRLFLETGRGQAPWVARQLELCHFENVQIFKDWAGIERIVSGSHSRCAGTRYLIPSY